MTATPQPADVVVIGGGPGGYVAAIRAAQLGLSTVCVEMDRTLGGTCVNVGCIPSKALLQSSEHFEFTKLHAAEHGIIVGDVKLDLARIMQRKTDVVSANTRGVEFLFKKNKVTWARGTGRLLAGNIVQVTAADGSLSAYAARNVIVATGSVASSLPFLPFDEERVLSNVGALTIPEVPKHLIVIGGGVIGLELGSVWRRLGAKVTVVEFMPSILPGCDDDVIKECDRVFRKQGLAIHAGTKVVSGQRKGDRVFVSVEQGTSKLTLDGDYVLVSIGRKPSLHGIDAVALGMATGSRGEILVDAQMRTSVPHVYAIGDVVGGKLLAHKAEEEGVVAAEVIAGHKAAMHHHNMPSVVYTWPEVATCGLAEHEVKAAGRAYKTGKFPFSANGRARTMGEPSGFVKFVCDAATNEILGCHIVGPNASELIAAIVIAMEFRASANDVGETVHAHPTLSEAVKEAALAALGRVIHS